MKTIDVDLKRFSQEPDPDPAFQAIPDPTLKLCQESNWQILGGRHETAAGLLRHLLKVFEVNMYAII